ncbi:Conserved hypothetical protein [Clostridium kluyveri DSM 555]|uniref:Uncharacterized protein n=1 Tax=Clostridium kluyveri (strain ATCC 8527 / DSM 555 / NBRC 12016 / NCIMB 10680 / K1) TaxID=431943 RepID=A5N4A9_CLOK5|nr:Conserved hypothetical protein [Clostridium kluyveri DSM 555]
MLAVSCLVKFVVVILSFSLFNAEPIPANTIKIIIIDNTLYRIKKFLWSSPQCGHFLALFAISASQALHFTKFLFSTIIPSPIYVHFI